LLEIFRRGLNSWMIVFEEVRGFAISDDEEFVSVPINLSANPLEVNRQNCSALNGTMTNLHMTIGGNDLQDDLLMTLRLNGVDTTAILTITAGLSALFSLEDIVIPLVITDLMSWRLDFNNATDTGTPSFLNSAAGGN